MLRVKHNIFKVTSDMMRSVLNKDEGHIELKEIFGVLSLEGSFSILMKISMKKEVRYDELKKMFHNESTFNRRLDALEQCQLIEKRTLDKKYRPTAYRLTKKGKLISETITSTYIRLS